MILLDFWQDFLLIVLILNTFSLYNALSTNYIRTQFLALAVTVLIMALTAQYYAFQYILFAILFLGFAWGQINPSAWFK